VESSRSSLLVNRSPKQIQTIERVETGELLAPFLFFIVVKGLTVLVRQPGTKHVLKGVFVGATMVMGNSEEKILFYFTATTSQMRKIFLNSLNFSNSHSLITVTL